MKKLFLLILFTLFGCTACNWHLRNPNETPAQLRVLYLDADTVESHFHVQLLNLLQSMRIHLVNAPQSAPFILRAYNYSLQHDNPPVSSTNIAITYTYTLTITVSITDASGKVIVPARTIVTSRAVTVNTTQIFTINATSVFQQELQREAINLIYYWLTSDQTRSLLGAPHGTQRTTTRSAP